MAEKARLRLACCGYAVHTDGLGEQVGGPETTGRRTAVTTGHRVLSRPGLVTSSPQQVVSLQLQIICFLFQLLQLILLQVTNSFVGNWSRKEFVPHPLTNELHNYV